MAKPGDKFKTWENVFDNFTIRTLQKLISQGHFDGLVGPLSIGKEANVFTALKDKKKVIVKIYRLETCDFNRMYDYIRTDPRFTDLKHKKRKIIFSWVQREYRNLLKAREAGCRVPTVHTFVNNVLVEEFIGDKEAAPKLKDCKPENVKKFLDDTIKELRKLYKKANLIHADLSQFNILNHNDKPVLIDMSQCTPLHDPNAQQYFKRDMRNLAHFFGKWGVKVTGKELIERISK